MSTQSRAYGNAMARASTQDCFAYSSLRAHSSMDSSVATKISLCNVMMFLVLLALSLGYMFAWNTPPKGRKDEISGVCATPGNILKESSERLSLPDHLSTIYDNSWLEETNSSTFNRVVSNFEMELLNSWCGLASLSIVINTLSHTPCQSRSNTIRMHT